MSYYTDEELRDFVEYAKDYCSKLEKEEVKEEELEALNSLVKIIVFACRYNAMVFESYIQGYAANDYLFNQDLEQLPLHINDDGLLSTVIVKWRLNNNK